MGTKAFRSILGKKMRITAVAALLMLTACATVYGTAVSVVNYPSLMGMVQKMVTNVITNKIQDVWNKEVGIKLEPGIINTSAITMPNINMESWTSQMVKEYVGKQGGLLGSDGSYYTNLARKGTVLAFPGASDGVSDFQKKTREISVLLAGAPNAQMSDLEKFYKARLAHLTKSIGSERAEKQVISELGQAKIADLVQKSNVASFEKASEGMYIAEKARKELATIKPSSFDGVKSDQAVKDLAKMMYYNTLLQAQTLAVMSNKEMSDAISQSRGGL